jgi:hypothetical protein
LAQEPVGGFIEFIFGGARRLSFVSAVEPFSLPARAVRRLPFCPKNVKSKI